MSGQKKGEDLKEMETGYTLRRDSTPYHFAHIKEKDAKELALLRESYHVVETINWTYAHGTSKSKTVHHNRYFTFDFKDAISLALNLEIESVDVAEEVVLIRPVYSKAEHDEAGRALRYFSDPEPKAVQSVAKKDGKSK